MDYTLWAKPHSSRRTASSTVPAKKTDRSFLQKIIVFLVFKMPLKYLGHYG